MTVPYLRHPRKPRKRNRRKPGRKPVNARGHKPGPKPQAHPPWTRDPEVTGIPRNVTQPRSPYGAAVPRQIYLCPDAAKLLAELARQSHKTLSLYAAEILERYLRHGDYPPPHEWDQSK